MQRLPSHKSYEVKFREAIVKTDLHGILLDAERKVQMVDMEGGLKYEYFHDWRHRICRNISGQASYFRRPHSFNPDTGAQWHGIKNDVDNLSHR